MTLSSEHLLDGLAIAAFAVDDRGSITAWNRAAESMTGRDAESVLGARSSVGLLGGRGLTPVDRALADEEAVEEPFVLSNANDEDVHAKLVVQPMHSEEGVMLGAVVTVFSAVSLEARHQQKRLRGALDGIPVPMVVTDTEFIITFANPAALDFFVTHAAAFQGASARIDTSQLVGASMLDVRAEPDALRRSLADASGPRHVETLILGDLIVRMTVSLTVGDDGDAYGYSFCFDDVSAVAGERASKDRADSLLAAATSAYTVLDDTCRVVYFNEAFARWVAEHEASFRAEFPTVSKDAILGCSLDVFQQDPGLSVGTLLDVSRLPVTTALRIGSLEFELQVSALFDREGARVGTGVEWCNQNARIGYRNEMSRLLTAARKGEINLRGHVDTLDPAFQPIMSGFNEIIDVLVKPMVMLEKQLKTVAQGDLTTYMSGDYEGAHNQLQNALNSTLHGLNTALTHVKQVAESVAGGARKVSETANALSQGATEQASSLEQISSAMSRLTEHTGRNSLNAEEANTLANAARENAVKGDGMMADMVGAMGEIEHSSQSIRKLIKVIDDLAFQTNLLALNAAVEAARAGAHGKGFAVVAEEVRSLAARSAKAASETTAMIEDSIRRVEQGTEIATRTVGTFKEIVEDVGKVSGLVAGIAVSSHEQSHGLTKIGKSLSAIEKVTRANTSSAEESAAGSGALARQARELQDRLARFKLEAPTPAPVVDALPNNLPPEVLAAIVEMLGRFGYAGAANNSPPARQAVNDLPSLDPGGFSPLDDDGFGKR